MQQIITTGVDIAILILVVEGAVLAVVRLRTGRGLALSSVFLICLSGLGLLVALKAALMQAAPHWIGIGLSLGGIAHAIDLFRRLRQKQGNV